MYLTPVLSQVLFQYSGIVKIANTMCLGGVHIFYYRITITSAHIGSRCLLYRRLPQVRLPPSAVTSGMGATLKTTNNLPKAEYIHHNRVSTGGKLGGGEGQFIRRFDSLN